MDDAQQLPVASYNYDPKLMAPPEDENLLIMPKKLPNPVMESQLHRNMHRELKINKKLGIEVLGQKSELDRVFREKKREDFKPAPPPKSDFELMLEKRRKAQDDLEKEEQAEEAKPEFLKIRNRLMQESSK